MIASVENYLTGKLVAAGIPAKRIAQEAKENRTRQMPFAELAMEPETLLRDGTRSGRGYDGASKEGTTAVRLFRRELVVLVKIVHRGKPELDTLLDTLLLSLEQAFSDPLPAPSTNSQSIRVRPVSAIWEDDPALLKNRAEVVLRILFSGGLYQETTAGTVQQVNPPNVNMIQ